MAPLDLPAALLEPGAYPLSVSHVEFRETHISWVFLAGSRVYKVKKPLQFSFLDYSTAERRRFFCEEEVRLNGRLAGSVYRRVAPIARSASGALRIDGSGEIIEHAVEMERLPSERMMDALLARAEISNAPLDELAERLVRFHREAATGAGVDEHGVPHAVRAAVLDNLGECRDFLSARLASALESTLVEFLDTERALFESRVSSGRIREGHGDLHAGNVCFLPSGVVAYDCIEFSAAFRCGDVASDLAFLAMDLDARAFRGFGGYLLHRYAALASDRDLEKLAGFYKIHRALVRAKVAALRDDADVHRYVHLAASYVLPRGLILTCGLPATGKSTAARALAEALGAVSLSSDLTRKRLVGLAPTEHSTGAGDAGPYTSEWTERTYDVLSDDTARHLDAGRTVIVDATFPAAAWRERFVDLARARGVRAVVVHLDAPEEVVRERLARRALDPSAVSDAGLDVYLRARERFEPPSAIAGARLVRADARTNLTSVVDAVIDELL